MSWTKTILIVEERIVEGHTCFKGWKGKKWYEGMKQDPPEQIFEKLVNKNAITP
jgi:hypothetical protein